VAIAAVVPAAGVVSPLAAVVAIAAAVVAGVSTVGGVVVAWPVGGAVDGVVGGAGVGGAGVGGASVGDAWHDHVPPAGQVITPLDHTPETCPKTSVWSWIRPCLDPQGQS